MVERVFVELEAHNSLSVCDMLAPDAPAARRKSHELLNQRWSPHKLSKFVSPGGAGQQRGYLSL